MLITVSFTGLYDQWGWPWVPWFSPFSIIDIFFKINLTCLTELKLVFYCSFTAIHKKHSAGCTIKTGRAAPYVAQLVWWAVWRCNESDWQDAIRRLSGPIRRWVSASYLWVESWEVQLINTTNWESVVWKRITVFAVVICALFFLFWPLKNQGA